MSGLVLATTNFLQSNYLFLTHGGLHSQDNVLAFLISTFDLQSCTYSK